MLKVWSAQVAFSLPLTDGLLIPRTFVTKYHISRPCPPARLRIRVWRSSHKMQTNDKSIL